MKHLIMGTAGHIDHGKTSLVKALTGIDCDTHKEEKQRGITINLGFSYLNLPDGESVGIIDVPGHKDFISTMVGGACGIDFVLLVIAADSGIMPQTAEHVNIIHALGIRKGIVVLTKADLVDDELIEVARLEIQEFLENTALDDAPVIPVSAVTGAGLDELKGAIAGLIAGIEGRAPSGFFRMYIDRIFSVKGFGSVVTGSVLNGSIGLEQEVYLLPGDHEKLRVRSIERHGQAVEKAFAGDRAAINLIGLDKRDFQRGMIISGKRLNDCILFDAAISLFSDGATLPLWTQVTLHTGTFETIAKIHNLNGDIDSPGEILAQVHLSVPAPLMPDDRFIIRNSSGTRTVGGGIVLDNEPLHHRKRTEGLYNQLKALANTMKSGGNLLQKAGFELKKEFRPFTLEEIAEKLDLDVPLLRTEIEASGGGLSLYKSSESYFLIDPGFEQKFILKIVDALDRYHKEYPIFPTGCDMVELAGKAGLSGSKQDKEFLKLLLQRMEQNGHVETKGSTYILKGFNPDIDARTQEEITWLENEILKYGINTPVITELQEKAMGRNIAKGKFKMYISYLADTGKLIFHKGEFIHRTLADKYRTILLEMLQQNNGIKINEFKNRIDATKRFCAILVGIYEAEKNIRTQGSGIETMIRLNPGKKV